MDEFEKRLENLKKPTVMTQHQDYIKLPLLNARKSAAMGWWLVALPSFFLACVAMKYHFNIGTRFTDTFFNTYQQVERSHGWWFSPLLFLIFPLVAAVMNLLSILHIVYNKQHKELIISIKMQFWNLFLIVLGFSIASIISIYIITENMLMKKVHHLENLHKTEQNK